MVKNDRYRVLKFIWEALKIATVFFCVIYSYDPNGDVVLLDRFLNQFIGLLMLTPKYIFVLLNRDAILRIILSLDKNANQW